MAKRRPKGEGSIYYRENKKLWVGQINLDDGQTKTKYAKTQKEIRDWLLEMRSAQRSGTFIEQDKITLAQFLDRYLADVAAHTLRPKTLEAYEYLIRLHIKPELGPIRLAALRPDQLQRLYADKLNAGLSRRTVQFLHAVLHKSLSQALKWGLVHRNVADLVDPPTVQRKERPTYSLEQVKAFLQQVEGHRWEPIYWLAVGTGLREGELLGVMLSDVQVEQHRLQVRHAIQYLVGKGLVITDPKSDSSKRAIPLPGFAVEAIQKQLAYRAEIKAAGATGGRRRTCFLPPGTARPSPRGI
jgi:integrase